MKILCEVSVKHVHLSEKDFKALFGENAVCERVRDLSQPGQYLSCQKVDLVGPKRAITGVSVLGPTRSQTQVELSRSDCFVLGLKDVPVRESGKLHGTPGITIRAGENEVVLSEGVIVMQRHVHMDTKTAGDNGFVDKQIVSLRVGGDRGGVLHNTIVRVNKDYAPAAHLDSDEGNALNACGQEVEIIV